jgi:hypothetical protein
MTTVKSNAVNDKRYFGRCKSKNPGASSKMKPEETHIIKLPSQEYPDMLMWGEDNESVIKTLNQLEELLGFVNIQPITAADVINNNIAHDSLVIEQQVSNSQYSSKYRKSVGNDVSNASLDPAFIIKICSFYDKFKTVIDRNAISGSMYERAQASLILKIVNENWGAAVAI